jgi:tryptophan halogenase
MKKEIVIIGGGASGWLTSLLVNKFWKDTNVTLIESSKIGILGAGEGSTPNFGFLLSMLDINQFEFFNETNSTIKHGLELCNWTGDNTTINHRFTGDDPSLFSRVNTSGYHFDARLVAKFFKKIALQRGINWVDGEVEKINGRREIIDSVELNDGTKIDLDLIFDCSGFRRLIIKGYHKEEWVSYTDYLIVNRALGFFLPQERKYTIHDKTNTRVTAMNSGWLFNIPLQHRHGCGYVFNDNYISVEEAKKEAEEHLGKEIQIQKVFEFDPGTYRRSWIGNSIALGLAYSFIEPLEATSLMTTIMQLKKLWEIDFNEEYKENFNTFCYEINELNSIFIRFHYLAERFDTPFWFDAYNKPLQPKLKNILDQDYKIIPKTNSELAEMLDLKELTEDKLPFFISNFNTIYIKNKKQLKKQLI